MTHGTVKPWLSVTAAIVYLIGNLYPIIADWIPPSGKFNETLSWFLVPTISWAILAFGVLWFCGFLVRAKLHKNERFVLERKPEFDYADGGDDGGDSGGVDGGKRRQGGWRAHPHPRDGDVLVARDGDERAAADGGERADDRC